jgi:hypothetical protein
MTDTAALKAKLETACLRYDQREERKRGYNRYALAQYLFRVDDVCSAVAAGASVSAALRRNFNDRLLTWLEKAAGVPVT